MSPRAFETGKMEAGGHKIFSCGATWHLFCKACLTAFGGMKMKDRNLEIMSLVTIIVLVLAWAVMVI